jgi:hypothetical protein
MRRLTQLTLAGAMVLIVVSLAAAQQATQTVARVGNYIEVAPDVFMHIIATGDMRWRFGSNYEFENRLQDRHETREINDTSTFSQDCDCVHFQAHFGVDMRYKKELTFHLRFRHWNFYDANIADDRELDETPGGVDKFGRAPVGEGEGMNLQQAQINYTFPGAPVTVQLGWQQWFLDQAGLMSDNSPRFGVFVKAEPIEAHASVVLQRESSRLGLLGDNDYLFYTAGVAFAIKPHRFQLDLAYFRDRFNGAPTGGGAAGTIEGNITPPTIGNRPGLPGFQGQKLDAVLIAPSWGGTLGPLAALLQGYVLVGTADSSNLAGVPGANREFDIFSWGLIAYAEANLGMVTPFVGIAFGSGDDDPTDTKLKGFHHLPNQQNSSSITGTDRFSHLDRAVSFGSRDFKRPALAAGTRGVFGGAGQFAHSVGHPFPDRLGNREHAGINTTLSNPGLILPYGGVKVFPLQGHEIDVVYFYRMLADESVIESAVGPVSKVLSHEVNAQWEWTLSRHFDFRIAGSVVIPADGVKDIARTSRVENCTAANPCTGDDPLWYGEARVRARF